MTIGIRCHGAAKLTASRIPVRCIHRAGCITLSHEGAVAAEAWTKTPRAQPSW